MRLGVGRIEFDLDDPASVAQVDEDQAAEVAAPVDPAVDLHLASDEVGSDGAGVGAPGQAHPPEPSMAVIVDNTSPSATLVCVFARISRITTSFFSLSSGPTISASRAPRLAALRNFESIRDGPGSKRTRRRPARRVEAR